MNKPSRDQMHADPANWKWGIFYFCREDQHIIIPKRIRGLGWTINFARPPALLWLAVVIVFIYGTLALARLAGASHDTQLMIKVLLAFGIIGFCYRMAHSSRRGCCNGVRVILTH